MAPGIFPVGSRTRICRVGDEGGHGAREPQNIEQGMMNIKVTEKTTELYIWHRGFSWPEGDYAPGALRLRGSWHG